jgi:multicomponent Na+:H+ antiporter subunit C
MPADTAILAGVLTGCGVHLIMRASFVRMLFGFVLLSHAANLIVIGVSGEPSGLDAPLLEESDNAPMVDPLPQAFVLTAIVINFSITAYLVVLLYRIFLDANTTTARELYGPARQHHPQ